MGTGRRGGGGEQHLEKKWTDIAYPTNSKVFEAVVGSEMIFTTPWATSPTCRQTQEIATVLMKLYSLIGT